MADHKEHTDTPGVVTTQWLKSQLDSGEEDVRVLDVTWSSTRNSCREDYSKQHIPNAAYFEIMHKAEHTSTFPRNLPDSTTFEGYVRSFGIESNTHVVVYDSEGRNGFFLGGRAWWMFKLHGHEKVSVLDGGLQKWIADGYPTTTDIPSFKTGTFTVKFNPNYKKTYEDMTKNLEERDANSKLQVCDSRARGIYSGESKDSKAGHYPLARNIPFAEQLLDHNLKTFKTPEQLEKVFNDVGIDVHKPVITMCNSAMSSCSLCLAAYVCGNRDVAVYHGGMTEWSSRAEPEQVVKDSV